MNVNIRKLFNTAMMWGGGAPPPPTPPAPPPPHKHTHTLSRVYMLMNQFFIYPSHSSPSCVSR